MQTDAPLDHAGKGRDFCPTDLVATALGTCLLTVMGIKAKKKGWSIDGLKLEVFKKMSTFGPRKIDTLIIHVSHPSKITENQIKVLKKEIKTCPVLRTIQGSTAINLYGNKSKGGFRMRLVFLPIHVFRETPNVSFFDAGVKGVNGSDVVIHHGNAISPPNDGGFEQYYVHRHQIDHNLIIKGSRIFTLINPEWDEPHHIIYLKRAMGALQIPIGTFHRSISNNEGSIVLNQAVRDENFSFENEFEPISLRENKDLQKAKRKDPVYWVWEKDQIKRIKFDPNQANEKGLEKLKAQK